MSRRSRAAALASAALLLAGCDQPNGPALAPAPVVNAGSGAPIEIAPNDRVTRSTDFTPRKSDAQPGDIDPGRRNTQLEAEAMPPV